MHFSYDTVVKASKEAGVDEDGYSYASVELRKEDSMENPASTKHEIYGPGIWLWLIHPAGIRVREIDAEEFADLDDTVARVGVGS